MGYRAWTGSWGLGGRGYGAWIKGNETEDKREKWVRGVLFLDPYFFVNTRSPLTAVQPNRHRPVVTEINLHVGLEYSTGYL